MRVFVAVTLAFFLYACDGGLPTLPTTRTPPTPGVGDLARGGGVWVVEGVPTPGERC